MPLTLVTAPAGLPLTEEEVWDHLRVNLTGSPAQPADKAHILALINAAVAYVDGRHGWLGRALVEQTWKLELDDFPCGDRPVKLPLAPLISVGSITYVDADGVTQTLSTDVYAVDTASEPGLVYLKWGQSWPGVRDQRNAVAVTYTCGYATTSSPVVDYGENVPTPIKQALKLIVGELYQRREEAVVGTIISRAIMASQHLLMSFRVYGADWG